FHGHKSGPFVSFTMWMTDQLSHFASQVTLHVFECSPPPPSILSPISPSSVTKDVVEFKATTKTISTCLRNVFYGARQLELAGLPIATYLAPHFQLPLQHYIRSYVKTIKTFLTSSETSKVRSLSDEISSVALVRLAKALVGNSMRWPELHLGQETLPNDGAKSMFVMNVRNDLSTVPPDHLEQIVVLFIVLAISFLTTCLLYLYMGLIDLMLMEIANDDVTWTAKAKAVGGGGASQFLAEVRMLSNDAKAVHLIEQKLRQAMSICPSGGKKPPTLAPDAWFAQYQVAIAAKT
ncbi:hypothetical protein DYB28_010684, partial [Aphanomyces astaci]